ncbi:MAG: acyl-CoA carboxylase subunit epsilon [Umezawaea sp.]
MTAADRPLLRIVRGNPDDQELAGLTAVVSALASTPAPGPTAPEERSDWGNPAHRVRTPLTPGPGAWRSSARPH